MKKNAFVLIAIATAALFVVPPVVCSKGGPGSADAGGDSGMGGGNSSPGITKGELFGDLYIIVRGVNGVPVLFSWEGLVPSEGSGFVQPIAVGPDRWDELVLPELPGSCYSDTYDVWLVPLNEEGEVQEGYEGYTQEVELGRLNLARSPQSVLDASYAEALAAINSATAMTNDPCGRLSLTIDGVIKTIDSPRENLGLYQRLMIDGYLPGITVTDEVLGDLVYLKTGPAANAPDNQALNQAASLLSAAGDKGTVVSLDEIIYLNSTLGINEPNYFDFRTYVYDRSGYKDVWAELLVGPINVVLFDDLGGDFPMYTGYYIDEVEIMDLVLGNGELVVGTGIGAFHAGVNDALTVLTYIHDRAAPEIDVY